MSPGLFVLFCRPSLKLPSPLPSMGHKTSKSEQLAQPCFLAGRADDELRSVIQMLRVAEILKLARCSHQLRRAANHPGAFLHAVIPMVLPRMHFDPIKIPLMRHAAVSLTANGHMLNLPDLIFPMRIFELDVSEWTGTDSHAAHKFLPRLAVAVMRHLRVLRWDSSSSRREMSVELVTALSTHTCTHWSASEVSATISRCSPPFLR